MKIIYALIVPAAILFVIYRIFSYYSLPKCVDVSVEDALTTVVNDNSVYFGDQQLIEGVDLGDAVEMDENGNSYTTTIDSSLELNSNIQNQDVETTDVTNNTQPETNRTYTSEEDFLKQQGLCR